MKSQNLNIFRWLRPDFLVVTALLFTVVAVIGLVSFNLTLFDPIEKALTDFNFSDLLYSKLSSKQELLDTNIVLVNIGHLDREQIARQIKRIRSYHPKVIGFDGFFAVKRNPSIDSALLVQLKEPPGVVMACYLTGKEAVEGVYDSLETSAGYFNSGNKALVNLGGANPETSTVRSLSPLMSFKNKTFYAMATDLVSKYDSAAFKRLIARGNEREIIHYIGNRNAFISLDATEVLDSSADLSIIRNKIVLMGYMGESFAQPKDLEDIFYTPLNPELAGRSRPDMYGVVIHANAASMILSGYYINVMPNWLQIVLSFIFCYFYVLFFTWFNSRNQALFELLFPAILLAINVLLVYTFFILYKSCNYSISATYFLVPVILFKTFLTWYERTILVISQHIKLPHLLFPPKAKS